MEISPDRTNWRKFCQEPPLTKDEYVEWHEMATAVRENDNVYDFIAARTGEAWTIFMQKEHAPMASWSTVVEWADANRALQRAEIKAYQEWRKKP